VDECKPLATGAAAKPAAAGAAAAGAAAKKPPACTVCTQMFGTRVEGHQKNHKLCPFFALYVMKKEIKQLEEGGGAAGAGAEGGESEALAAKRSEHKAELCRMVKAGLT
jgi:hypothetical protein